MVQVSVLLKLIYRLTAIPIKIPARLFVDTDKPILKFMCEGERIRIAATITKKKHKV